MRTVIIGCKTLENEILQSVKECQCEYETIWIDSGLHNFPKQLKQVLQETLDCCVDADKVLIAMGFCGNSFQGVQTRDFTMIIPRVDDCISLLVGSCQRRVQMSANGGVYFLTEGWLKGERNIWKEYEYTVNKYGEETGREIFRMMFGHYQSLILLNTGCFSLENSSVEAKKIAEKLDLKYSIEDASLEYLKKLITGPWNEKEFLIVPPKTIIQEENLILNI